MTDIPSSGVHTLTYLPLRNVLRAFGAAIPTACRVAIDCRNAMLGTGMTMGKAFEMIYVEPYQARRRDDWSNPENF